MKWVLYGTTWFELNDIARLTDLSVEELDSLSYEELWTIIDDYNWRNE